MANTDILYIEDNFHNRRIVRKVLERQGHTLHECEDGLEGYQMLKEMKPGIVLLDISLPSMDGMEIAGLVKADPELEHIYLIALTASAMQGDRERFLDGGCDDYLSKPFRALDLVDLVGKYMSLVQRDITTPPPLPSEIHDEGQPEPVAAEAVKEVEIQAPPAIEIVETEPVAETIEVEIETEAEKVVPAKAVIEQQPIWEADETQTEAEIFPVDAPEEIEIADDNGLGDTAELVLPPQEPQAVWAVEQDEVVGETVVEASEIHDEKVVPAKPVNEQQTAELPVETQTEAAIFPADAPEEIEIVEDTPLGDTVEPNFQTQEPQAVWAVEQEEGGAEPVVEVEIDTPAETNMIEETAVEEIVFEEPASTEIEFSPQKGKKAIAELIKAGIADAINPDNLRPVEPNA